MLNRISWVYRLNFICTVFDTYLFAVYLSSIQVEVSGVHFRLSVISSLWLLAGLLYVLFISPFQYSCISGKCDIPKGYRFREGKDCIYLFAEGLIYCTGF